MPSSCSWARLPRVAVLRVHPVTALDKRPGGDPMTEVNVSLSRSRVPRPAGPATSSELAYSVHFVLEVTSGFYL